MQWPDAGSAISAGATASVWSPVLFLPESLTQSVGPADEGTSGGQDSVSYLLQI